MQLKRAALTSHYMSAHAEITSSLVLRRHGMTENFLLLVNLKVVLGAIYVRPTSSFRRSFVDTAESLDESEGTPLK